MIKPDEINFIKKIVWLIYIIASFKSEIFF